MLNQQWRRRVKLLFWAVFKIGRVSAGSTDLRDRPTPRLRFALFRRAADLEALADRLPRAPAGE